MEIHIYLRRLWFVPSKVFYTKSLFRQSLKQVRHNWRELWAQLWKGQALKVMLVFLFHVSTSFGCVKMTFFLHAQKSVLKMKAEMHAWWLDWRELDVSKVLSVTELTRKLRKLAAPKKERKLLKADVVLDTGSQDFGIVVFYVNQTSPWWHEVGMPKRKSKLWPYSVL